VLTPLYAQPGAQGVSALLGMTQPDRLPELSDRMNEACAPILAIKTLAGT